MSLARAARAAWRLALLEAARRGSIARVVAPHRLVCARVMGAPGDAVTFTEARIALVAALTTRLDAEATYAAASRDCTAASVRGHSLDPSDLRAAEHARTAFAAAFARMTEAEAAVRRARAAETIAEREYARAYRAACLPEVGR